MFDELIRQMKRTRAKNWLSIESRRHAKHKTGQVRVSPQLVQVTEEFSYRHTDGRWQPDSPATSGRGRVSVITSIDDQESLKTPGRLDLRALQLAEFNEPSTGSFLTFHNHGMTDIEQLIAAETGFDSLRLRLPPGAGRPAGQPPELGLQNSHQLANYRVDKPSRAPIEVLLSMAEGEPPLPRLGHGLYLTLDVRVYLPNMGRRPQPRIDVVELNWPWLAEPNEAVEVRRITRADYERPTGFQNITVGPDPLLTTYDTTQKAVVCRPQGWRDSHFDHDEAAGGSGLAFYYSLLIDPKRPLQLINGKELRAKVGVTFDSLLSGTEVRLHHSTGYLDEDTRVETTTSLRALVELDLERAMSKRLSELRQRLRFPGVQPSGTVIDAIRATVLSCGYRPKDDALQVPTDDQSSFGGLLRATRLVEGSTIEVVVRVRGRFRRVDRTLRAGGPRFTEELLAGDVQIDLYGTAEGSHHLLTAELNNLHANLRARLSTFVEA